MALVLSTNLIGYPDNRGGLYKEIDALPGGTSLDNIFYFNSPNAGKFLVRVASGPLTAAACAIVANGSDQAVTVNAACAHPNVREITFDYAASGTTDVTINGTITGTAKRWIFNKGNRIIGTGTINNIEYDAGDNDHVFSTGLSFGSVSSKREYVTPKHFGATGNNVTDDLLSFTKCNSLGKPIEIPIGTYFLSDNFSFTVPVKMREGAIIRTASGKKVTFTKAFTATPSRHFIDATRVIWNQGTIDGVEAIWWVEPYVTGVSDATIACQTALDSTVESAASTIYFPPGAFTLTKGLLVWKDTSPADAQPDFVNINIIGAGKSYSLTQTNGGETLFVCNHNDNFGLGLQRGKGCVVMDIGIRGNNVIVYTPAQVVDSATNWTPGGARDNQQSPYAGFVVDPIGKNTVSAPNRYPGFESYYDGVTLGGGGTNNVFIRCKAMWFTVGYMVNPHATTQNGDLTIIEDCWGDYCKVAVATGESQSRSTQIRGFWCWGSTKTVFDSKSYGNNTAPLPEVIGCNIAGGVKFLYQMNTFTQYGYFKDVYAESLYCLGGDLTGGTPSGAVGFKDSHFNFMGGESAGTGVAPILVRNFSVTFDNCFVSYYSTAISVPLNVSVQQLTATNCTLYGLFWNIKTIVNGGSYVNENFNYQSCVTPGHSANFTASTNATFVQSADQLQTNGFIGYLKGLVMERIHTRNKLVTREFHDSVYEYSNTAGGYTFFAPELITATVIDAINWTFVTTNAAKIAVGDYVYVATSAGGNITFADFNDAGTPMCGQVTNVSGTTITVKGKIIDITNGSQWRVLVTGYKKIRKLAVGDIASGSNSITNILAEGTINTNPFNVNDRISHPLIPFGTKITNVTSTTITLSANATGTETQSGLFTTNFAGRNSLSDPTDNGGLNGYLWGYKRGDIIYNDFTIPGNDKIKEWICTKDGIVNSAKLPEFKAIYFTNIINITSASDVSSAIPADTVVEKILINPSGGLAAFSIGTTNGGAEISGPQALATGWQVLYFNQYYPTAGNIWFNGITSSTQIKVFTE